MMIVGLALDLCHWILDTSRFLSLGRKFLLDTLVSTRWNGSLSTSQVPISFWVLGRRPTCNQMLVAKRIFVVSKRIYDMHEVEKLVNNNIKNWHFENIKNIVIFSLENIMILSLIYNIIDIFVPTRIQTSVSVGLSVFQNIGYWGSVFRYIPTQD